MKNITLLFLLAFAAMSYSQDNWQQMMFDRNENFYDIQADFQIYYQSKVTNTNEIPKGLGIKQFKRWEYYWESRGSLISISAPRRRRSMETEV